MKYSRGFTLIEVLVVLVLMAMAYTLVPPAMFGGGGVEMHAAARQLAAGMRKARDHSIHTQRDAVLLIDVEGRQFTVSSDDKKYPLPEQGQITVYTAQAEVVDGKQAAIRFFPDGSSTGGAVTLSNKGAIFRVQVDWLTGSVAIRD